MAEMTETEHIDEPVSDDVLALSAAFSFIDTYRTLFIEFIEHWYDPDTAERILGTCHTEGILND